MTSPSIAAKYLTEIYVQRSSLDEGVEPQANGGRKIPVLYLYYIGMTHDLVTSCNGSDVELTTRYRVASVSKLNGFGRAVVQRLVKTNVKKNLYFEIKDKVIEEAVSGHMVNKRSALVKVYGLNSTKEVRNRLIELLYERVQYHKDKFIAPILHAEMQNMQVKKNGKVEHSDQTHDDQVFSYLMALYVWYDGKNLMENWNLIKNTIKTDEDEEIVDGDIDRDSETESVNLGVLEYVGDDEVELQMQYINESNKRGLLQTDYNKKLQEMEDDRVKQMMASDPVFRATYNNAYHNQDNEAGVRQMIMLPNEIFGDSDDMESAYNHELHGNLFDDFMGL